MKSILSALLVLSLVWQSLLAQTPTTTKPQPEAPVEVIPIEDLLPADTLGYVATSHLAGLQHSLQLLDAYKVAKARLPKEALDSGDSPLDVVSRFLSFGIDDARALEGARIGFALLLPEMPELTDEQKKAQAQNPTPRQPLPEPLILLFLEGTRIEDARQAREQLIAYYNDNFSEIGKPSEIKQINYKGHKLDRFKDSQVGMWFGATYVLSQTAAIDRLLNLRADRRAERLADDQEFLRTKTQMMPQTGLFAYVNGKPLNDMLNVAIGGLSDGLGGGLGSMFSALLGTAAIKSAALSSTFDREGVVDRLQINLDPAKKNLFTTLFSGPKSEFKATQFIPAGTEIVVSHSLDWVKLYDEIFVKMFYTELARAEAMHKYSLEQARREEEARARNQKPPEQNWEQIRQKAAAELTEEKLAQAVKDREARTDEELGFVLRDELAKDLGHEITVAYGIPKLVVAAVDAEGKKKDDTGWAVFIGIKDRVATQQALIKAFAYFTGGMMNAGNRDDEQQNAPPKTDEQRRQQRELRHQSAQAAWAMMPSEIYKKVELKSVFAAWLGFSDEYLIVADSKETIKQMLDLSDGGRALASDYNYSRALGRIGSATTKVFIGPKMFDGMLNDFLRSWVANPNVLDADLSDKAPLNVPATVAAALEADASSIKLEAFSPLGLAGTVAFWAMGSDVQRATERKENDARQKLWELRKAEKIYARKNKNKYASLESLAKAKVTLFDVETLKREEDNYKFAFKLKPHGKGYEATATPIKYGRQGRKSFFIDETDKLRVADKQGAVATASDEVIEERVFGEEATADEAIAPPPPRPVRRKR
jgi:hypothetical protein